MNYAAPAYGVAPVAATAATSTTKIIIIIAVVAVVGLVVFVGIVAIALGVGLGLGLRKSDSPAGKLSPPVVNCDAGTAQCGCPSTKPTFSARIINGDAAVTNSWPWMVYLTMNYTKVCSGFLISRRHVLTASSCVRAFGTNITVNYGSNLYQSTTGGINVTSSNFTSDTYDSVAIITLGINLTASNIMPCCLSSDLSEPIINEHGVIAGWGETTDNTLGTVAPTLQQAVVQVRDPSACTIGTSDNQFCASYDPIRSCPIDAGGPFMASVNNAWTCVGIMTGTRTTCGSPITFTRVSAYQAMIRNITSLIF